MSFKPDHPCYRPSVHKFGQPAMGASLYGVGWGGPAKGLPVSKPVILCRGNVGRWRTMEERKQLAAEKAARLEQVIQMWGEVMLDQTQPGMARVSAGDRIYDRLEGKPPQTNTNLNLNVFDKLPPDQQRAVVQALGALSADPGDAEEGTDAADR